MKSFKFYQTKLGSILGDIGSFLSLFGIIIGLIIVLIALIGGVVLLFAFPVKWLWNWLMPDLFGLTIITFWQAFGILLLSVILFKSPSSWNINIPSKLKKRHRDKKQENEIMNH